MKNIEVIKDSEAAKYLAHNVSCSESILQHEKIDRAFKEGFDTAVKTLLPRYEQMSFALLDIVDNSNDNWAAARAERVLGKEKYLIITD